MMDKPSVSIVGGGLAGALLALVLADEGLEVDVFERRPDLRDSDAPAGRSINLAISARGLLALERVGLDEIVKDLTIPMRGRMIHHLSGDVELQPYSQNPDEFIRSVSRSELNRRLLLEAGHRESIRLHFETRCDAVDLQTGILDLQSETIPAFTHQADIIIGADGAGSAIRRSLEQQTKLAVEQDFLIHGYKELTIPPDEIGLFRLEPEALHIWPRGEFMLIALPNLDRSFTCTLFMPNQGPVSFAALESESMMIGFFERQFPDVLEHMPGLAKDYAANPVGRLGTIRCQPWHFEGRALLIGDAAHAVVPFFGQGMNCAFEDVTVMSRLIQDGDRSWEDLFNEMSRLRIPDANAIADMAIANYLEMRDSVTDPVFVFRKKVGFELERRFPHLFIPNYSLVSFRTGSYAEAQEMGRLQHQLLDDLCAGKTSLEEIDWALAETRLHTFCQE